MAKSVVAKICQSSLSPAHLSRRPVEQALRLDRVRRAPEPTPREDQLVHEAGGVDGDSPDGPAAPAVIAPTVLVIRPAGCRSQADARDGAPVHVVDDLDASGKRR